MSTDRAPLRLGLQIIDGESKMKWVQTFTLLALTVLVSACHAHPHHGKKVVVVKNHNHSDSKVILIDDDHRRNDYTIVHVKPGNNRVCRKHRRHWHCVK